MGNAQQMHYVENKRQFELARNKILNRLNEQGYFEHNGLTCWNNPLNDDTEPEAFRPQWLEEEYHIIFNKEAGEYCVIGDDDGIYFHKPCLISCITTKGHFQF